MQARLVVGGFQDLYAFWGTCLAQALAEETDFVLNLASKEYSRAVLPHLPTQVNVITCLFGEAQDGKVVEKGTLCKMARGQMVRWLAEEGITQPEEIRAFRGLDYQFSPERSTLEKMCIRDSCAIPEDTYLIPQAAAKSSVILLCHG